MKKPPLIWPPRGLSKEETAAIKWLSATMYGLLGSVEAWEAALELFQYGKSRPPQIKSDIARRWQWIAIHECVMQVSFLREQMDIIRGRLVKTSPLVHRHLDKAALRSSFKLFDEYFPDYREIRHAIAHSGEVSLNPERHSADGSIYAITKISSIDRLELEYKGRSLTMDITRATLTKIEAVVSTFWDAFAPAARELEAIDPQGAE